MNTNEILNSHIGPNETIDIKKLDTVEKKVLFVLYFADNYFRLHELTTKQIFDILHDNLRLPTSVQSINIAIKRSKKKISSFRKKGKLHHKIMSSGIDEISSLIGKKSKKIFDSIIPNEIVVGEKDYIKKVILQVNGCYQDGYYDACFVMIRRIIETLIVDVYEHFGIQDEIKNAEGDYLQFNGLIDKILVNQKIKLSKIAKKDLKNIKKFGDTAAHNRKLNLKKPDIDKYSDSIRLIVEELINYKK